MKTRICGKSTIHRYRIANSELIPTPVLMASSVMPINLSVKTVARPRGGGAPMDQGFQPFPIPSPVLTSGFSCEFYREEPLRLKHGVTRRQARPHRRDAHQELLAVDQPQQSPCCNGMTVTQLTIFESISTCT